MNPIPNLEMIPLIARKRRTRFILRLTSSSKKYPRTRIQAYPKTRSTRSFSNPSSTKRKCVLRKELASTEPYTSESTLDVIKTTRKYGTYSTMSECMKESGLTNATHVGRHSLRKEILRSTRSNTCSQP